MRLSKDVIAVLWSYDPRGIDPEKHQKTIIIQVLNWGTKKATDWLFKYYGKKQVAKIASTIPVSEWDKKSLALWKIVLNIKPRKHRHVR